MSKLTHQGNIKIYEDTRKIALMSNFPIQPTIKYDKLDINSASEINFAKYSSVIVAFTNLDKGPSQLIALMAWVEAGGRVFFEGRPAPSNTFSIIYKKAGINTCCDINP